MLIDRRVFSHFDWPLLAHAVLIPLCSLVVLFSAGYDPDASSVSFLGLSLPVQSQPFLKQSIFLGAALVALVIAFALPPSVLHRYGYLLFGGCVVLLGLTLFVGTVINGSRRWLDFGPIHLQTAEPMKVGLILAMGRYITKYPPKLGGYSFTELIVPLLMIVVPMGLIAKQPDLGSALSVGAAGFFMLLFAGIRWKTLITMALVVGVAVVPVWNSLHSYQQRRVMALFDPEADPLGSGYHITQSKIAVGSGAAFGKGFLKGTQTQLEFLPEHTTDFIFSVLAEEWGFVGCVAVLLLYFSFLYRLMLVVVRSKDLFTCVVSFGVAGLIFFHTVVNIGMVVGVLPVVGITMPLFSYGGSSLLSFMILVGISLGISMRRFTFMPGN